MMMLSGADIEALMRPGDWLAAARAAMLVAAGSDGPIAPRAIVSVPPVEGLLAVMPGWLPDTPAYGAKIVSVSERPKRLGGQPHQGVIVLFDAGTGMPAAILDATAITERRTAWASALATDLLARGDARTLAVLGTGVQARAHIEALRHVRRFADVRVWGRSPDHATALAAHTGGRATLSVAEALAGADVVCTVTAARAPLFEDGAIEDGVHVNAVGASIPGYRELPTGFVARSDLWVDHPASAAAQADDLRAALGNDATRVLRPLGLLLGQARVRDGRATLFRSVGVVAQDLCAAAFCVERARAEGRGVELAFA